jgi:hypothetical protein
MNLQKPRILFAFFVSGFLILCNLGYLFAYSNGRQQEFASQIDKPTFQILSLLLLAGIIIFAVAKAKDEDVNT